MKVLLISASPNTDGLTAACAAAAAEGVAAAGGEVDEARLNDMNIELCRACDEGWGGCRDEHCSDNSDDDFAGLHQRVRAADAYILVTPVYWGEMSEIAKAFTDRLRRCEATLGEQSHLAGKPVIAVAAAGGTGGGMITCLASIERWIQHVRARTFDLIPVNRWTREYKLAAIHAAGRALVQEQVTA
jgi:multimeric flavodoxin WrbA